MNAAKPIRVVGDERRYLVGQKRLTATVALGLPTGGTVHWPFALSIILLEAYLHQRAMRRVLDAVQSGAGRNGVLDALRTGAPTLELFPQQGFFIEDNRNEIARRFMTESSSDWLLMIDSDIAFPPELVEMLLTVAGTDKRILGASVPLGPPIPTSALRMTTQPGEWVYLNPDEITPEGVEVHGLGMPVCMVHRDVLQHIADREGQAWFLRKPVPRIAIPQEGSESAKAAAERSRRAWLDTNGRIADRQYINQGEDLSFCLRAMDAGFKIWACRLPGLRHHKTALPLSHDDKACPQCGHGAEEQDQPVAAMEG